MAKIVGFFKTLRNHWKKSTFAVLLFAYGADYGHDKYLQVPFWPFDSKRKEFRLLPIPIS